MIIIVMGVSGSGKTTVGKMLAEKLNLLFYDADDFHPIYNLKKMSSGIPLTDKDRKPWLEHLNTMLHKWELDGGAVLACSALKEEYRKYLSKDLENIKWVFLSGSADVIAYRIKNRTSHYMPPELLDSQFSDLEEPEYGIKIDVSEDPGSIINQIIKNL